ncbi:thiamine-phosphate diphosphorylase [Sporothrix brasiliensis 5110]|uniref:Thiamine-phosphate diphosphorylase n=1 Tax=Sporothrix brasiliensis 5110 TaxID=1398154 RepID=A0A0C2FI08_9PEZI|nr:thiamine-phosphate diphosphorylase [Sporothrix brasiliensis 5110]KIH90648.1 thiamine-phosphate diphosphorylase [Sporothrix brasiliensis 5110]
MPPKVDYSVYLVTDPTPAILGPGRTVVDVVGAAFRHQTSSTSASTSTSTSTPPHIGIVQLRDKDADARTMLATLAALHEFTGPAGAPLLVNDRVDVAVAAAARGHCEGVHLGQDDIDVATARRMLGPDAIIGVTASTVDEAVTACRDGADYLGLGTVFATPTKTNTKHVVGTAGIQRMLQAMAAAGFGHIPAVCIGGVNASNARRVVFQSGFDGGDSAGEASPPKALDGVAVVSAIMGAADPFAAAEALAEQVRLGKHEGPTAFYRAPAAPFTSLASYTSPSPLPPTATIQRILQALHETTPLSHNMTNLVVQNIAANVALAVGASPIMSNSGVEAADLARLPGSALVINMGTATPESLANYVKAIAAYNAAGRPVVFDPVGAGATAVRRAAVRTIMAAGYLDVIKGNEGEIQTVYLSGLSDDEAAAESAGLAQQRGVDGSNTLDAEARIRLVRRLAAREKCVVVLTGAVDYVSDSRGARVVAVADGHPMLGQVTGTGCSLGTVMSASIAAAATLRRASDCAGRGPDSEDIDTFAAVLAGMALYERAAARAAVLPSVKGPGTFVPAFLDELSQCRRAAAAGDMSWLA